MTKRQRKKPARPIKSRRDYEGASAVVKQLSGEAGQDSAAENRLQLLLRELDRYDTENDADADSSDEQDYSGPRRRWSDDTPDSE